MQTQIMAGSDPAAAQAQQYLTFMLGSEMCAVGTMSVKEIIEYRADFMAGMGKVNGRFVNLLDVGKVLSVDDIVTLASVAGADEAQFARFGTSAITTGAGPCTAFH